MLLETLASRLPTDSIRFSSRLVSISQRDQAQGALLELDDGTLIQAKARFCRTISILVNNFDVCDLD